MSNSIKNLNLELEQFQRNHTLNQVKKVILAVVNLLDKSLDPEDLKQFKLFSDNQGKIRANSSWFFNDEIVEDRKATYIVSNNINIDVKLYGLSKLQRSTLSWIQSLTPNFEDELFYSDYNVGIDFAVSSSLDKIIVILSKNYALRTIELTGSLTATYQEIFDKWSKVSDTNNKEQLHQILWESFDVSPLNKRFYEGIFKFFEILRQHLINGDLMSEKQASMFSNRLIGRVIFCWFLKKKSLIDDKYKYFDSKSFDDDNKYYRNKLFNLFFLTLNTPIDSRITDDLTTPYLNGGLFEKHIDDELRKDIDFFPSNYFDEFYSFLSMYNFTTDESTSQFQQVEIDPEMLGQIFENFLAEISDATGDQARKLKGAFYTPREIVDKMCRNSLYSYLQQFIEQDEFRDQRLQQLIFGSEKNFKDQDQNWRRDWKPYKERIINLLDNIKILDPACGSGAFPIGMMQLLLSTYERLEARFDVYKSKLTILKNNIYGVDIEPMAVEISRLRAWLSLIVDESKKESNVSPLPNLEFKFVCANSLVHLNKSVQNLFDQTDEVEDEIQKLRTHFFLTENANEKLQIKTNFNNLISKEIKVTSAEERKNQILSFQPFNFESQASFFDSKYMFGVDSFDIIIGNPPYVRHQKLKYKKNLNHYHIFESTADLSTYFFEFALLNLKNQGIYCLIVTNKFFRALYGQRVRHYLASSSSINYIIDFEGEQNFLASVDTAIVEGIKVKPDKNHNVLVQQIQSKQNRNFLQSDLKQNNWNFINNDEKLFFSKLESDSIKLINFTEGIYYGILTGFKDAFVLDEATKNDLIKKDKKNKNIIFPLIEGKDIEKYKYTQRENYLLVTKNGINVEKDYPTIAEFLIEKNRVYENKVKTRGEQGETWMNLRSCTYYSSIESVKIVWSDIAKTNQFCRVNKETYLLDTAFMLVPSKNSDIEILLGILNSKLILAYMKKHANLMGLNTIRWKKHVVRNLPIPNLKESDPLVLSKLKELVLLREKSLKNDFLEIESKIDELIYKLYNLSDSDISVIESILLDEQDYVGTN